MILDADAAEVGFDLCPIAPQVVFRSSSLGIANSCMASIK